MSDSGQSLPKGWTVSLVELRQPNRSEAVSGGAMDRVVERKRIDKRILIGGARRPRSCCWSCIFWLFAPRCGLRISVSRDRLTIATAQSGTFDDFLPLARRGSRRSSPSISTRSRAAGSRRSWSRTARRSIAGQLLAVLSNAELQLSTLEKQAEVEQQLNNMRSQELALTPDPQRQPARPQPGRNRPRQGAPAIRLAKAARRQGFVSTKTFNDTKDDLTYQQQRLADPEAQHRRRPKHCRPASCSSCAPPSSSLNSSMGIARSSLGQLNIRAPVDRRAQRLRHPARPVAAAGRAHRPDRQRRRQQAPGRRRRILSRPRRGRADGAPPTSTARPIGSRSQRSIRRSATASSRSTWCSTGRSRRRSSAARPSRPS